MCGFIHITFYSVIGAIYVGLSNGFSLTQSTPLVSVQITSQSVSHQPVSAQRNLPPQSYVFRGCDHSARSSLMVFIVHSHNFFIEDLRPYARKRFTEATFTSIKCHCQFGKSFLWSCGASLCVLWKYF